LKETTLEEFSCKILKKQVKYYQYSRDAYVIKNKRNTIDDKAERDDSNISREDKQVYDTVMRLL
jgi:hypothetical protein